MRPSKKAEIVERVTELFYRHGFQATGMDQLVAETGISKTSIYNHFPTKEALILAALDRRDLMIRDKLFARMKELGDSPRGQLLALFDALFEWFSEPDFKGCMFVKACSEFQDGTNPIHQRACRHVADIVDELTRLAREAKLSNPEHIAQQLAVLKEGAIAMATMRGTPEVALAAKAIAQHIIAPT